MHILELGCQYNIGNSIIPLHLGNVGSWQHMIVKVLMHVWSHESNFVTLRYP